MYHRKSCFAVRKSITRCTIKKCTVYTNTTCYLHPEHNTNKQIDILSVSYIEGQLIEVVEHKLKPMYQWYLPLFPDTYINFGGRGCFTYQLVISVFAFSLPPPQTKLVSRLDLQPNSQTCACSHLYKQSPVLKRYLFLILL
jgi:hypothetical protein